MSIQEVPTAKEAADDPFGKGIILYLYPSIQMRLSEILKRSPQRSIVIRFLIYPSPQSIWNWICIRILKIRKGAIK
jgi:hypothetical protein